MKRRTFLKFTASGFAASMAGLTGSFMWQSRAHASTISKTFYITEGYIQQADGNNVYFRGFSRDASHLDVPGESFIVQQGDTVRITIVNTLGTSHSFKIDGVVDSGTIRGGETRTIEFQANQYGSFLYHDGLNAPYNRLSGLHGGMAVMPQGSNDELYPGSPTFKIQKFWVFHDIDPVWHDRIANNRTPSTAYKPRYFTLNGLWGRPPGAPGSGDPNLDAMHDPRSALHGSIGDRTLMRMLNPGLCRNSVHTHANHMEWLTRNGEIRDDVWFKDCIYLPNDKGRIDAIYPFEMPPDSYPPAPTGKYPMHLHNETTQTSGGGLYMFGAMTDIFFE
jgi:hypothetical protein